MVNHTISRPTREPGVTQETSSLADAMGALAPHAAAHLSTAPWYKREPWLAVCLAAFVPVIAALLAPQSWRVPLTAATAVLMFASMVMLVLHLRKLRTFDAHTRSAQTRDARTRDAQTRDASTRQVPAAVRSL